MPSPAAPAPAPAATTNLLGQPPPPTRTTQSQARQEESCSSSSASTQHPEGACECDQDRSAILESLQRLSCHLPRSVLRECIAHVRQGGAVDGQTAITPTTSSTTTTTTKKPSSQRNLLRLAPGHTNKSDEKGDNNNDKDDPTCSTSSRSQSHTFPVFKTATASNARSSISRAQLVETLTRVEDMLEQDDFSSSCEDPSESASGSYTTTTTISGRSSHHGRCTSGGSIHFVDHDDNDDDDDDDSSNNSYEEELSDLEEEGEGEEEEENEKEDLAWNSPATPTARRIQRLSQSRTIPSRQQRFTLEQEQKQRLSSPDTTDEKLVDSSSIQEVSKLRQGRLVARNASFESARSVESGKSNNNNCSNSNDKYKDETDNAPYDDDDGSTRPGEPRTSCTITTPRPVLRQHKGAILFADISGFTKLSTALPLEPFSKVIHTYVQKIVQIIQQYGGDIQKFAGDAVLAEWTDHDNNGNSHEHHHDHSSAALAASLCATQLVHQCSDFAVEIPATTTTGTATSTSSTTTYLNVHAAVGYGTITTHHVGDDDGQRMEHVLLGDALRQVSEAILVAKQGEVVASPEFTRQMQQQQLCNITFTPEPISDCREDGLQVIAYKDTAFFHPTNHQHNDLNDLHAMVVASSTSESSPDGRTLVAEQCRHWSFSQLEDLHRRISPYAHVVVMAEEVKVTNHQNKTVGGRSKQRRLSIGSSSNAQSSQIQSLSQTQSYSQQQQQHSKRQQQSLAELRDVCTIFIQPDIPISKLTGGHDIDEETLQELNQIMWIVSSEVDRFEAHLRQFIVDDKGLVIIVNFGLRGSTFPNMVEERAMPFISHIRTLVRSELALDCRVGATYGKAYCGVITTGNRTEYTVLGPAVNLAARLMTHARNPGVLVDEEIMRKAGNRPFTAVCPIQAKGYTDYVNIYVPDEDQQQRSCWKECAILEGRKLELARLVSRAEAVMVPDDKSSRMAFLEGPYGIGKSCLLSHAVQTIEELCNSPSTESVVLRHVCCDDDSFTPFSIVRPLFLEVLRAARSGEKHFADVQLVGHTETHESDEIEEAQMYVILLQICLEAEIPLHYVEVFAGLIFSTRLSDIGTWSDATTKMNEWNQLAAHLVKALIHSTRKKQLVLLGLDNLPGLDEMSWKVIQGLFYSAPNVLVMGAARSEFDLNICLSDWNTLKKEGERFFFMRLEPLDEVGVADLVNSHLAAKGWSKFEQNVARTVFLECKGNPLIAMEILGALYPSVSSSQSSVFVNSAVKNVEELVLNRIDSLSPGVRPFLNLGAILGSPFYLTDIIAVMERYHEVSQEEKTNIPDLARESLQEAVDNGLLSVSVYELLDFGLYEAAAYSFSHSMWQDTISKQILEEWKDTMKELINEVVLKGKAPQVPRISPLRRTRPSAMPVIRESTLMEDVAEDDEPLSSASEEGKPMDRNKRLQAMTRMFRRSYKSSGRKGARESLKTLKGMLTGGNKLFGKRPEQ